MDTGLWTIPIEDIRLPEAENENAAPMHDNARKPIIVVERDDHYVLLDGYNRVSGLMVAGQDTAHAVLVTDADLASRSGGDDEDWNEEMYMKYVPYLSYCGTAH